MQNKKLYENIPFESKRNSVKIFKTVTNGERVFRPHWHEHMELLYVTSGKGTVMCRDEYFKVEQGDLMVFNGNDLHSGYRCDREFSYITVIYDIVEYGVCEVHRYCKTKTFNVGICNLT